MTEIADRFARVADGFSVRVTAVPVDAWDNPAPCEGWTARDVVGHLVEWVPSFFATFGQLELSGLMAMRDGPALAWESLRVALQAALDDEEVAGREMFVAPADLRCTVAEGIDRFVTGDVLVHTWDLARATGLDERLDPAEVHRMFVAMEPMDDLLRQSGQFGPRVPVADDADDQTKLIAFTGRRP